MAIYWLRMKAMGLDFGDRWFDVALRFAAWAPGVGCSLIGTSHPGRLRSAADAVSLGPLDAETLETIREAFAPHASEWRGEI